MASTQNRVEAVNGDYVIVSWPPAARSGVYHVAANIGGVVTKIGEFLVPKGPFAGRIPVLVKEKGPFTVAGSNADMSAAGSVALFSQSGPGTAFGYDPATTEMLGAAGTALESIRRS